MNYPYKDRFSKEPRPQGGALKPKIENQTEIPNQVRDDKNPEPDPVVMLNLFQHLWPDARTGFCWCRNWISCTKRDEGILPPSGILVTVPEPT
jgi:hypothetical protein